MQRNTGPLSFPPPPPKIFFLIVYRWTVFHWDSLCLNTFSIMQLFVSTQNWYLPNRPWSSSKLKYCIDIIIILVQAMSHVWVCLILFHVCLLINCPFCVSLKIRQRQIFQCQKCPLERVEKSGLSQRFQMSYSIQTRLSGT